MNDSHIHVSPGGTSYVGPDATALFRAKTIKIACSLYARTGMRVNRAYTPSAMLQAATSITGKPYKRGQHAQAAQDLEVWCATMVAALPIVDSRDGAKS